LVPDSWLTRSLAVNVYALLYLTGHLAAHTTELAHRSSYLAGQLGKLARSENNERQPEDHEKLERTHA
jgi:hypothetical protein